MLRPLFDTIGQMGMYVSDTPEIIAIDEDGKIYGRLNIDYLEPTTQEIKDFWGKCLDDFYADCFFDAEGFKEIEMNALLRSAFFKEGLEREKELQA